MIEKEEEDLGSLIEIDDPPLFNMSDEAYTKRKIDEDDDIEKRDES